MKKNITKFLFLSLGIICFSFYVWSNCEVPSFYDKTNYVEVKKEEISKEVKAHAGIKKKRLFLKTLKKKKSWSFYSGDVFRWLYRNETIYVLDDISHTVFSYDFEKNKVIKKYGGRGGAPWENVRVFSFDVIGDYLYTLDNAKSEVRKVPLQNETKVVYAEHVDPSFWTGSFIAPNSFLILSEDHKNKNGDFFFFRYDAGSKKVHKKKSFANISQVNNDDKYLNIAYEGNFWRNTNGDIVYLCSKAGLFLIFDNNGNFVGKFTTIDNTKAPKVTEKHVGDYIVYIKKPDVAINYTATMDSNNLYILSLKRFIRGSKNLVIDVYAVNDGKYKYSMEVPNVNRCLPKRILKAGDKNIFYIVYNDEDMSIVKYESK